MFVNCLTKQCDILMFRTGQRVDAYFVCIKFVFNLLG